MTQGWVYNIRLFSEDEKPDWEEVLQKHCEDRHDYVGAQWDANKAKEDPPEVFEKGVQYRPVFLKK